MPEVDAVVGVGSCEEIADVLERAEKGEKPVVIGDNSAPVSECPRMISTGPAWAYLLIAEGLRQPLLLLRHPSHTRALPLPRAGEKILAEAEKLASYGYRELILVAQDLTRYGKDVPGWDLARLLRELCRIDGIDWIRLHYLYPHELTDELIEVIASEPKIVKYLDIPIQHINDRILKLMNRRDTGGEIRALFKKLRERIPGLVLRTSLISGLPGEGEAEFDELCAFLREERIERAGVFPFSPEEGTPAAAMEHADAETARERAVKIQELQAGIMDEWEAGLVGRTVDAVCDYYDAETGAPMGRAYFDSPGIDGQMEFTGEVSPGDIVRVEIISAGDGVLKGKVI